MKVHAVEDPSLGNRSYLLEVGGGLAATVDVPRDIDAILDRADRLHLRVVASLETHLHADFVSGSRELAERTGAAVYAAKDADLRFDHRGVGDGDVLRVGDEEVAVLHTPGHTPEHVSYRVGGAHVFSGGSLISGGAARTDLVDPELTEAMARRQFHSLRRLAALPDEVVVHPTHGAGSFCSAGPAGTGETTVGEQRRANPLLQIDDEDAFVRALLSGFWSYPPYFLRLRAVNRMPALLANLAPARALSAQAVASALADGAWLIDARPVSSWAQEHPVGAVSNELRPAFASWLGWIVGFGEAIVLLVDEPRVDEAIREARRIGYDRVLGWMDGGLDAWKAAGLPVARVEQVGAEEARRRQSRGARILDVRQRSELTTRIPGSVHVELGDLIAGRFDAIEDADEVIAYCGHGERSATAASLLERRGVRAANLDGGIGAWERAALALTT